MKKTSELQQFIENVLTEKMNAEIPETFDPRKSVEEIYSLDSLSMFELIVNLEEKYGIKVPDDELADFGTRTLEELEAYLEGALRG